jgi:hypothetical protein
MKTLLDYITFRQNIADTVIVALFWVWSIAWFLGFVVASAGVIFGTISVLGGVVRPEGRPAIIAVNCLQIFGFGFALAINVMVTRIACEFLIHLFRFFDNVKSISDSQLARGNATLAMTKSGSSKTDERYQ